MSYVPNLIEEIIKELNETEFEVPFRSLLRSVGHTTVFQKTHHGPGEHGKDIVSFYQQGNKQTVYVFLIKTKDIPTARYRSEVRPELTPMIEVPFTNKMIRNDAEFRYVFVSTGDLSRDALEEFEAFNSQNMEKGLPQVELWNRSELVKLFFDNLKSLPIFLSIEDDLARNLLNIKSGKYNRADWFYFVKQISNQKGQEKYMPVFALAAFLVASQAYLARQEFVAFDVLKILLVKIWETILQFGTGNFVLFDKMHDEFVTTLEIFIEANEKKLLGKEALFDETEGSIEAILYPMRTFSTIGVVSYLAYFWGLKGDRDKEKYYVGLIESIVRNNPVALTPPIDFYRKDIAIALMELCINQRRGFAEEWIKRLMQNLYQRFIKSGWWPIDSVKPKEIINHTFGFTGTKSPHSNLLVTLFRFCAKIRNNQIYDQYRILFKDFCLLEFVPSENIEIAESELFSGNLNHGTTIQKALPSDFEEFYKQTSEIQMKEYSPMKNNRPYVLQLVSDVHLQYVFPEIYLNFKT